MQAHKRLNIHFSPAAEKIFRFLFLFVLLSVLHCSLLIVNCYSQQPTEEWVRRFTQGTYANGLSVKSDSQGNVYVLVKTSQYDSTLADFCVLKYSAIGSLLWSAYYNNPQNWNDIPTAFALSPGGDVYITGNTELNFVMHVLTVKFSSTGIVQWAKVFNGGGSADEAADIAVDRSGNIVVVGNTSIGNTAYSLTIKYNSSTGDSLWVSRFGLVSNSNNNRKVVLDDSGSVYTVGDTPNDYLMLKFNSNGVLQWYATYDSPQHYNDLGFFIAIDTNRNTYVVGTNSVPSAFANNTLLMLNNNGVMQWASVFNGVAGMASGCGIPAGLVVSPDGGSIFFTTECYNGLNYDIVTLKYGSSGDSVWVRRYSGGGNGMQNVPSSIRLDRYGAVYVSGNINQQSTGDDLFVTKYQSSGIQQWVATYNGPLSNSFDYANDLVVDTALNVYVTGVSSRYNGSPILWDAVTIKYNQPIGIQQISSNAPNVFELDQNYPNPFNPTTKIKFQIPKYENVKVVIYDLLGREIEILVNEKLKPGTYTVDWDGTNLASGIYFYTIITDSFRQTKKAVVLK